MTLELFRAADGRLEGVVRTADGHGGPFDSLLDLLRVIEGLDLTQRATGSADRPQRPDAGEA